MRKVKFFCNWGCCSAHRVRPRLGTETVSPPPPLSAGSSSAGGAGAGSLTHLCVPGTRHRPGPELATGALTVNCSQPLGADRELWASVPFWAGSASRRHYEDTEEDFGRSLNTGCPRPGSGSGWQAEKGPTCLIVGCPCQVLSTLATTGLWAVLEDPRAGQGL